MIVNTEGYIFIPGERDALNSLIFSAQVLKTEIDFARGSELKCHRGTQVLAVLDKNPGLCLFEEPFWTSDLEIPLLGGDVGQSMFDELKAVPSFSASVGLMSPLEYDWCEKLERLDPGISLPPRGELGLDYEFLHLSGYFYVGYTKVGVTLKVPLLEVDTATQPLVEAFTTIDFSIDPTGVVDENIAFVFDVITSNHTLGYKFADWFMSALEESTSITWVNDDESAFDTDPVGSIV